MIIINDRPLNVTKFPNGEKKIQYLPEGSSEPLIHFKWESDADFIELMFLADKLKSMGRVASLAIVYLPYSRMDRQMGEDFFTLKSICKFINSLEFTHIYVDEPHSDVSMALLDNVTAMKTTKSLFDHITPWNSDIAILYPDAGAQKRYYYPNIPSLLGEKTRDPITGKIQLYNIYGKVGEGQTVIILDDLCSYGGTFVKAARALKNIGAGDIYLVVAHCEKSILKGKIFKEGLIKQVITTNSIINEKHASNKLIIKKVI